jgi:putative ABC transport system permease protein
MTSLLRDLRYALRSTIKRPGFTVVAVLTLALGIGANSAIFSVVDAALVRPLPYGDPERLVHVWEVRSQADFSQSEASYPDFLDLRESQSFEQLAGYNRRGFIMTGGERPEPIMAGHATANFFDTLGVQPALGRAFEPGEDRKGANRVVVLTHTLWQSAFGGDSAIVGKAIPLDGNPYTVVGVLPQGFQFALTSNAQLWVPLDLSKDAETRRSFRWCNVVGRLKPDVSTDQARTELNTIAARIEAAHPDSNTGTRIRVVPLRDEIVGKVEPILLSLLAAVGFILLITCANMANLLLARAGSRTREIGVRIALGATRGRLVRQLLTESVALALVGGALGLLCARWMVDALVMAIPTFQRDSMPYLQGIGVDTRVLLVTALVSLAVGILFGIAPAIQMSRPDVFESLKDARASGGPSRRTLRNALVISEVALTLVLLVGAGLMVKSFARMLAVDPGFDTANLLTMNVILPRDTYSESRRMAAYYREVLDRVGATPGVRGASSVDVLPLRGGNTVHILAEGKPEPPPGQELEANTRTVSPGYFDTMGIPMRGGRDFANSDDMDAPFVVALNTTLARRLFPELAESDVVGKRVYFTFSTPPLVAEVVAVVGDEKVVGLDERTTPVVYGPVGQDPSTYFSSIVVRTEGDSTAVSGGVQNAIRAVDPNVPVVGVTTMEQYIANSPFSFRRGYPAILIGGFAILALLLSAVGIYGVLSSAVTQRMHEMGVRVALGASRGDILRLIVGQGMAVAGIGLALGCAGAFALGRFASSLLFEVSPTDPVVMLGAVGALAAVAFVACYVPARRATRVDPLKVLRYE